MSIELSVIDDERIHPAIISPDGMLLTLHKDTSLQLSDLNDGSALGCIVINGTGSKREIQNEASSGFGKLLKTILKKPHLKIQIV